MSPEMRVKILLEAKPNSWIAFSHDEESIVAQGSSYLEAVEQAEVCGENDPVLMRVPEEWLPMVL